MSLCGRLTGAVLCSTALLLCAACHRSDPAYPRKVIVLGVDGMDPGFVERHWADLPNLRQLRDKGSFTHLATTTPPQSPVAWSTVITGMRPDAHGIFDFVHRDASTLAPFSSMSRTEEPRFTLSLGRWRLPVSSAKIVSLRQGTPFWKILSDAGVPVTVLRMPTNYPPVNSGRAIAGMGTPDLRGTQGTFTFYTDDPEELERSVPGGRIVKVEVENQRAVLPVQGPPNSLRKDEPFATAELVVDIDPEKPVARFRVVDQLAVVREGEWSEWLAVDFPLLAPVVSARGTFRLFVRRLHPRLEIYLSPINVDPAAPVLPVSAPSSYSRQVAEKTGRFYTLGIAEDTAALRQHVFTLPQFLSQTRLVFEDEQKLLRYALGDYRGGLLFFYFSVIDENSHVLWGAHEPELLRIYSAVDECVGEVMRREPSAELIVMSDHGFSTFTRAVNLNTWLSKRGFLTLNKGAGEETSIADADWRSTEAYALGLNGLYLNLAGREKNGVVTRGERSHALIETLREQLLAFRDPETGVPVVEAVHATNATAQNAAVAPDLIVGYGPGYRGSWQTGLGGVPVDEIVANNDPWIGDHCINPERVPGVLFTSRKMTGQEPGLQDVSVTVLKLFGRAPESGMSGKPFL